MKNVKSKLLSSVVEAHQLDQDDMFTSFRVKKGEKIQKKEMNPSFLIDHYSATYYPKRRILELESKIHFNRDRKRLES